MANLFFVPLRSFGQDSWRIASLRMIMLADVAFVAFTEEDELFRMMQHNSISWPVESW